MVAAQSQWICDDFDRNKWADFCKWLAIEGGLWKKLIRPQECNVLPGGIEAGLTVI